MPPQFLLTTQFCLMLHSFSGIFHVSSGKKKKRSFFSALVVRPEGASWPMAGRAARARE